jgi:hypothetical protein
MKNKLLTIFLGLILSMVNVAAADIFESMGVKPVSMGDGFEAYTIPNGYWSPSASSEDIYRCKIRTHCAGGDGNEGTSGGSLKIKDTVTGKWMSLSTYQMILNDKSLLVELRGEPPLSAEDKVKLMNSLKLELSNANEGDKPALIERLKKISQEIFSQTAVTPETMALMNEVSRNMELAQRRARAAQASSDQNMMLLNHQITTQQAESAQTQLQNTPPVETPAPVGD